MIEKFKYLILFLIINFGGLALGSWLMNNGPNSDWYLNLDKAPWTPPGWVFGAAWTSIMVCFSIYMSIIWNRTSNKKLLLFFYSFQYILNVSWNPIFFSFHHIFIGLIVILFLTCLIGFMFFHYKVDTRFYSIFILPYFVWLIIASSLNGYIFLYN